MKLTYLVPQISSAQLEMMLYGLQISKAFQQIVLGAFYKLGMVNWKIVSKLTYLLDFIRGRS